MANTYKNANGNSYLILDQHKDIALLAQIGEQKFVVAFGFNPAATSWGSGAYFNAIEEAHNRFKEEK